ncbi:MAG: TetR/AcrR family transcriptional regulator [Dehalococcoidia bacterium]|nr:TetR/AcrR family transcriptional regulator [Dehalococcoidia bacterium]
MQTVEAHSETASRRRRRREREERIQSILRAAQKVFFTRGYARATMDEIALVAEITKPTIYAYFPTKDDLFLSLMLPVIDDIGVQLSQVEERLDSGRYRAGGELIRDILGALVHSYTIAPEAFKLVQLVQQTKMLTEFGESTRRTLDEGGRRNFESMRRILKGGINRGLIRPFGVYELGDVIWGSAVGVIQLEEIKSTEAAATLDRLRATLQVAEQILVHAVAADAPGAEVQDET